MTDADSGNFDPAAFTDRYGYTPEQYLEKVAVSTATAPTLARQQAALAAAKAKLTPGGWEHLPDAQMQAGADAENLYLSLVAIVDAQEAGVAAAKAYAAGGDFGAFRSVLGVQANMIIDAGGDVDASILAAVQAALA